MPRKRGPARRARGGTHIPPHHARDARLADARRRAASVGAREGGRLMSVERQQPRVAFQGERGAFGEEAAVALLGQGVRLVPRPTFEETFGAVGEGAADYALAPIENSPVGTNERACDRLLVSTFVVAGEVFYPIMHNLVGCRGGSATAVRVIESHPAPLAARQKFFAEH